MANNQTVTINGKTYDAKTGLPVEPEGLKFDSPKTTKPRRVAVRSAKKISVRAPKKIAVSAVQTPKPAPAPKPARAARRPAPSQTLNRRFVGKPAQKVAKPVAPKPAPRPIVRNIPRPTISTRPTPVVPRGIRRPAPVSSQPEPAAPEVNPELLAKTKQRTKLFSLIISGAVVVVIAILVLAYFFIPAVSFGIASARADVKTSLPTYAPAGYNVSGTAESSPGIVILSYKSANGAYSISMANSNWDSDGVLENKVKPVSANYQTLNQKGLTIFVFGSQAMWVNGGILYTVSFDHSLANTEILKIVDGI